MNEISQALANLEAWLESMRGQGGYGGPVVHWWANCLSYTGRGLDWRYEGIILGYLTLWQRTCQQKWLDKARRAGDDLVGGQLPGGNFLNSSFEANPYPGGTPHEAAADIALLHLAKNLRDIGEADWIRFADTAERNLRDYFIKRLWDEDARSFRDHPDTPSLVPNKACTLAEALFAWTELRGDDELIERYALPTLRAVLALQVKAPERLAGAIPQNWLQEEIIDAYYPYYIARCVPALLIAHEYTGEDLWLDAAAAALAFIERCLDDDGLLPQVLYTRGENRYPQWIAPLGDVLRSARLLANYGRSFRFASMESALLSSQLASGAFPTARGFAAQISQNPANSSAADFRDYLPVVGWNDKTFRCLSELVPKDARLPKSLLQPVGLTCQVGKQPAVWTENESTMRFQRGDGDTLFSWRKGQPWADLVKPEVLGR